jgi:hypothetical protein
VHLRLFQWSAMTSDNNLINRAMRDAFGDKVDLAEYKSVGSGVSETIRMSLNMFDGLGAIEQLPPWLENRGMVVRLFTAIFERSFLCPGRDADQCCRAPLGVTCLPCWREREDPEWYAQEINKYLTMVDGRIAQGGLLAPPRAADEAFALGCLFTEALIKFRWDRHAKRGVKIVDGSKLGGAMRRGANPNRRDAAETVAAVDALLKGSKSLMDAYRTVAKQQGVSDQTIRKEYRAAKKPG